MPEMIINASGEQYGLVVNPDGSINTIVTGSILIGSVSAHVDSLYIQSGDNININKAEVYGSGTFNVAGTITTGSQVWVQNLGSETWVQNIVGVSGTYFSNIIGSVNVTNIVVPVSGIIDIGNFSTIGSKVVVAKQTPLATSELNPYYQFIYLTSGTATNVTGSYIGSIIMFVGAGSYVSTITYDLNRIVSIGSYS